MTPEQWNKENPVGTEGLLKRDNGDGTPTKVLAEAYEMGGKTVAFFEGVRGCYLADRFLRRTP